ncbi:MAG: RES domain-containing protein [Tepidiformaceae bacterium]
MTPTLASVAPDGPVYRLARAPNPWAWPRWSDAAPDGTFGNRWDDPEGNYRVLYASSSRLGALIETLARFRPDLRLVAELNEINGAGAPVHAGTIPAEWFKRRLMGIADLHGTFADMGAARSLAVLRARLAARALHYDLPEIDASAVRLVSPRAFTQEVSRLVYESQSDDGEPFSGIRYGSRLDDASVNWAIFEPGGGEHPPFHAGRSHRLRPLDDDVREAVNLLGLHAG